MPKLKAYHRPSRLDEALKLLSRPNVATAVIAGGTYLTAHLGDSVDEAVDLQALGLTQIHLSGDRLSLDAMVRLQTLIEDSRIPSWLHEAAYREGPNTFRHAATIGGVVVGAGAESELLAALLVSEAQVQVQSVRGSQQIPLADFLSNVPAALNGGLVTAVSAATGGESASARVARTPADSPIVAAVARRDAHGKIHLALCGVAATPILIEPDQVAGLTPPADFRGSSEYRRHMAITLAGRVMAELNS